MARRQKIAVFIAGLLCTPIVTASPAPSGMICSIGAVAFDQQQGDHIARDFISLSADALTLTMIRLPPLRQQSSQLLHEYSPAFGGALAYPSCRYVATGYFAGHRTSVALLPDNQFGAVLKSSFNATNIGFNIARDYFIRRTNDEKHHRTSKKKALLHQDNEMP